MGKREPLINLCLQFLNFFFVLGLASTLLSSAAELLVMSLRDIQNWVMSTQIKSSTVMLFSLLVGVVVPMKFLLRLLITLAGKSLVGVANVFALFDCFLTLISFLVVPVLPFGGPNAVLQDTILVALVSPPGVLLAFFCP